MILQIRNDCIQELKQLATGGMIDIESLPENLQKELQVKSRKSDFKLI